MDSLITIQFSDVGYWIERYRSTVERDSVIADADGKRLDVAGGNVRANVAILGFANS